ncbi:hypothetical protein Hanom_Chr09g00786341 [Helianthus anomalus]
MLLVMLLQVEELLHFLNSYMHSYLMFRFVPYDLFEFLRVRWMIQRSLQSKIMMGPTGLGHKVPTKLVQVKGNILESGRLV